MLLVTLEYFQSGFEQALQLRIVRRGDQQRFQCAIDLLVVGDLIFDVSLVESLAVEFAEFVSLGGCCRGQGCG